MVKMLPLPLPLLLLLSFFCAAPIAAFVFQAKKYILKLKYRRRAHIRAFPIRKVLAVASKAVLQHIRITFIHSFNFFRVLIIL